MHQVAGSKFLLTSTEVVISCVSISLDATT